MAYAVDTTDALGRYVTSSWDFLQTAWQTNAVAAQPSISAFSGTVDSTNGLQGDGTHTTTATYDPAVGRGDRGGSDFSLNFRVRVKGSGSTDGTLVATGAYTHGGWEFYALSGSFYFVAFGTDGSFNNIYCGTYVGDKDYDITVTVSKFGNQFARIWRTYQNGVGVTYNYDWYYHDEPQSPYNANTQFLRYLNESGVASGVAGSGLALLRFTSFQGYALDATDVVNLYVTPNRIYQPVVLPGTTMTADASSLQLKGQATTLSTTSNAARFGVIDFRMHARYQRYLLRQAEAKPGALILTPQSATLNASALATTASLTLSGKTANLPTGQRLAPAEGLLALFGSRIIGGLRMTADPRTESYTPQPATLDPAINPELSSLTLSGQDVTFTLAAGNVLRAEATTLRLLPQTANVSVPGYRWKKHPVFEDRWTKRARET